MILPQSGNEIKKVIKELTIIRVTGTDSISAKVKGWHGCCCLYFIYIDQADLRSGRFCMSTQTKYK